MLLPTAIGCSGGTDIITGDIKVENMAQQNLLRSIQLSEKAVENYIMQSAYARGEILLYNTYNIESKKGAGAGSVWRYTSLIETINSLSKSLSYFSNDEVISTAINVSELIKSYNTRNEDFIFNGMEHYTGTMAPLTSYTQTRTWTVYGVNRSSNKGNASVNGVENVYDDQMWLIREFLESYHITGDARYLAKAEYLANYCLDGYDQSINPETGEEFGGITWGPGYTSKHTCSNGPIITPLVELYKIYKDSQDTVEYYYIDHKDGEARKTATMKKSEYYLSYAKKVYDFCKNNLLNPNGVYDDLVGGDSGIQHETVDGIEYRVSTKMGESGGRAYTYNSGSVLMGVVSLYEATGEGTYLDDAKTLADSSFDFFATPAKDGLYSYPSDHDTMWFNLVLLRGYLSLYPYYDTAKHIASFQDSLNYSYDNYYRDGFLPGDLVGGWHYGYSNDIDIQGMSTFSVAAMFAVLAEYEQSIKPLGTNKTI